MPFPQPFTCPGRHRIGVIDVGSGRTMRMAPPPRRSSLSVSRGVPIPIHSTHADLRGTWGDRMSVRKASRLCRRRSEPGRREGRPRCQPRPIVVSGST